MKHYFLTALIFATLSLSAQKYASIVTPEELAAQKNVLVENFPHQFQKENIIDVQKADAGHAKVTYTRNGTYYEAFIKSGPDEMFLIETDRMLATDKIPAVVKGRFETGEYKGWHIDKGFSVATPYNATLYRLDVYKENKKDIKNLYFDDKGQIQNAPPK